MRHRQLTFKNPLTETPPLLEAKVIGYSEAPAVPAAREQRAVRYSGEPWPSRAGRNGNRAILQFMAVACMAALIVLGAMMTHLVKDVGVPSWMVFAGMGVLLVAGGAFVCGAVMMDQ